MTDLISFTKRQSYHLCLHPDCYIYKAHSRKGTTCSNVWIAPAPLWTKPHMFSKGIFAGYTIGVYNRTGIVDLVNEKTYPLTIWKSMAREAVTKAQRQYEDRQARTRPPGDWIRKRIDSCFT
jgi:hypothetical protein